MKVPLLLCGLWLATAMACLAPKLKADFEADLKGWVGKPIAEFIVYKGEPAQAKLRPEGGKVYVFERNNTQSGPYKSVRGVRADGSLGWPILLSRGAYLEFCRLILETDTAGTILTTRWEGNDCW